MHLKPWRLLVDTAERWTNDQAPALAAALAYYTAFAISPLIFITTVVAGFFYADATQRIANDFGRLIPGSGGEVLLTVLKQLADTSTSRITSTAVGVVVLLFGATAVFGQLQDALNVIWGVPAESKRPLWTTLKRRLLSFTMLLGAAFLLLVSLVVTTLLTALFAALHQRFTGIELLWHGVSAVTSLGVATLIFALIFKIVPDCPVGWSEVWLGALLTGLLFLLGQLLLARYLGQPGQLVLYGGFGSLIVLLLWVYYSAQILLFGAEFTHVYALTRRTGARTAASTARTRPAPARKKRG